MNMRAKRMSLKRAGLIMIVITVAIAFSVQPVSAGYDGYSKTIHKGKYYFKYDYGAECLLISKKKRSGFKATPVHDNMYVTDGKIVIYLDRSSGGKYTIKRYTISSKKKKVEKKLPKSDYWEAQGVSGKYLWIGNGGNNLYRYDILTKKLKLKKKKFWIFHLKDQYYIGFLGKQTVYKVIHSNDSSGNTAYLHTQKAGIYRLTKDGKIKVVKSLGTIGAVSDNIYYVTNYGKTKKMYYSAAGLHKLYRINSNGKSRQLIATFRGYIGAVYDDHCILFDNGQCYSYIYKTKQIRKADWEGIY